MSRYPQRGRIDVLNASKALPSLDPLGVPDAPAWEGELPPRFLPWTARRRVAGTGVGLHCFLDDTHFEPVWTNVWRYRDHYENRVVCSPDFSMYTDWPLLACMWNVYRARWLARAMHELGAYVIPSVTWAGPETYSFAFRGLALGGTVAISAYGARRFGESFRRGYDEMIRRLAPKRVVVVGGRMPEWMTGVHYFKANTIGDRREAA